MVWAVALVDACCTAVWVWALVVLAVVWASARVCALCPVSLVVRGGSL